MTQSLTWAQVLARRLERNHLLRRAARERMLEVAGEVGGIQAQVLSAAELGLAIRVDGITQDDVRRALWADRTLVKSWTHRSTLHLVPSSELPMWLAARRAITKWREPKWYEQHNLTPKRTDALLAAIVDVLDGRRLLRDELATEVTKRVGAWAQQGLQSQWSEVVGLGFQAGLVCFGPSEGARVSYVRRDQWLRSWSDPDPRESLIEVARRYLRVYGPATPRAFATWFAGRHVDPDELRAVFESIGVKEVDVAGKRAWTLADDIDAAESQSSVRLLPQYDCYILGSRFGREQIVTQSLRDLLARLDRPSFEGAVGHSLLLVDGVVDGIWKRTKRGKRIEVAVTPVSPLGANERKRVREEADRIAAFLEAPVELEA